MLIYFSPLYYVVAMYSIYDSTYHVSFSNKNVVSLILIASDRRSFCSIVVSLRKVESASD